MTKQMMCRKISHLHIYIVLETQTFEEEVSMFPRFRLPIEKACNSSIDDFIFRSGGPFFLVFPLLAGFAQKTGAG